MTYSKFYELAFSDAEFRRKTLDNMRFGKQAVIASCSVGVAVTALACLVIPGPGVTLERAMAILFAIALVCFAFDGMSARIAALEAIEARCKQESESTPPPLSKPSTP